MPRFSIVIAVAALLSATAGTVAPAGEQLARKVVYNEATKSYFELRTLSANVATPPWPNIRARARSHRFKNVAGRLAMVRNRQIATFLRENFELIHPTWIGGRYLCAARKLIWEDGTIQKRRDGWLWLRKWYHGKAPCQSGQYMPVLLRQFRKKIFWQAVGANVGVRSYLVEYRTSAP